MSKNKWILLTALLAGVLALADGDECDATKKYVYGCDAIEPLYQVRIKLNPTHGPITLGYWQNPFPPGMPVPGSKASCQIKRVYEAMYSATTTEISEVVAFGGIGTDIKVTNLGNRPVKLEFTGSPAGEPLGKGASRKFSLTTAAEDQSLTSTLALWKIWEIPEKKNGKTICSREAKKSKLKAQVVTLKVQTDEPGLWEEPADSAAPSPLPSVPAAAAIEVKPLK